MSKGGGSTRTITTQTAAPEYARPFLEYGLSEARRQYESATPEYYPGSTVVGFSPETATALEAMKQQALAGSPLIGGVQQAVMQNLTGTNPFLQAALKPTIEQAMQPAIGAGRYGSAYAQRAIAEAVAPQIYAAQQAAIQQAPAAYQFGQVPMQQLAQVGAAKEALEQAQLAADIERFQFEQMKPAQKLADYMTLVTGGSGALGGQTITPQYRSPALGFLSGGLAGLQGGQMLGMGSTGMGGLGLLGALLGGFGG